MSGVTDELRDMETDLQEVAQERGTVIMITPRTESEIGRDTYSSIKKRPTTNAASVYAFPIEFGPNKKNLERAGIKEQVDAIAWICMKEFTEKLSTFEAFDFVRATAVVRGNSYDIREKSLVGQFADTFEYVTLGLVRR